jgi:hypothetical protein
MLKLTGVSTLAWIFLLSTQFVHAGPPADEVAKRGSHLFPGPL